MDKQAISQGFTFVSEVLLVHSHLLVYGLPVAAAKLNYSKDCNYSVKMLADQ